MEKKIEKQGGTIAKKRGSSIMVEGNRITKVAKKLTKANLNEMSKDLESVCNLLPMLTVQNVDQASTRNNTACRTNSSNNGGDFTAWECEKKISPEAVNKFYRTNYKEPTTARAKYKLKAHHIQLQNYHMNYDLEVQEYPKTTQGS